MHLFWLFRKRGQSPYRPQQSSPEPVELPVSEPIELPGSEGGHVEQDIYVLPEVYIPASSTSNAYSSFTKTKPEENNILKPAENSREKFFRVKRKTFLILVALASLVIAGCICGGIFGKEKKAEQNSGPPEAVLSSGATGLSEPKITLAPTNTPNPSVVQISLTTATITGGTRVSTLVLLAEPTIALGSTDTAYEIPTGEGSLNLELEITNGICENQQEWGLGPCSLLFFFKVRVEEESRKSDYKLKTAQTPFNETTLNRPFGTTPWYGSDRNSWEHRFDGIASGCNTSRAWGIWVGPNLEVWVHLTETLDQPCEIDEGVRKGTRTIAPMFCQCGWVGELSYSPSTTLSGV